MRKSCSVLGCDRPVKAKLLCTKHYEYHHRGATLGPDKSKQREKKRHILTDVDAEKMTATCAVCGTVDIIGRSNRKSFECGPAKKASQRDYVFRRKYGITLEERDGLWLSQDRKCAICRSDVTKEEAHTDHDHVSGVVRGILCGDCNRGLGMFRDSIEFLGNAVRYLS